MWRNHYPEEPETVRKVAFRESVGEEVGFTISWWFSL